MKNDYPDKFLKWYQICGKIRILPITVNDICSVKSTTNYCNGPSFQVQEDDISHQWSSLAGTN